MISLDSRPHYAFLGHCNSVFITDEYGAVQATLPEKFRSALYGDSLCCFSIRANSFFYRDHLYLISPKSQLTRTDVRDLARLMKSPDACEEVMAERVNTFTMSEATIFYVTSDGECVKSHKGRMTC